MELAAQALPDHPRATRWRKMSRYVAADSRGKWSEEDAQIYQPVWMCSLIRHADLIGDETLFDLPQVRYYFDYFLNLLSPAGNIPDFGDGRWNDSWAQYAACLERAAAECGRADFKWAAARIYSAMAVRFGDNPGVRSAAILVDAYRWADDSIEPEKPSAGSGEVLDDLVGKKIVFRDGWDARATYLMLNYRDEGDYAVTPKEYLRQTIPVEEEKMHHGHADENSICLLMSGGSVLLHDGGYRSKIPSGPYGAFRADYFHNRLVARRGKPGREQPLFEFIRNSGAYEPVRTELIDFTSFDEVDVSRTRMTDAGKGVMCDRVIAHLKADDMFIVFDIVKMLQTGYYTFSTLWHATDVLEEGDNHYVTAIDAIQNHELPRDKALLIDFVRGGGRRSGTFPITRHWQDEIAVYQTISSHYHAGQVETFVTVLVPHERGSDVRRIVDGIELLETDGPRDGLGVAIAAGENTRYLCVKTDLARGVLTENVRPRYTFDSGRVRYGPFATDASFLYARRSADQLHYAATHLTRIDHDRETIFAAQPNTFGLQPDDLSTGYGPAMWRAWDDVMPLR